MILIDTDVLVDVAFDRRPHSEVAVDFLDLVQTWVEGASVAWHTISNLYYVVRPIQGDATARDFILNLVRYVDVVRTDTEDVRYAVGLPMRDFEDAMQVAAARACGARAIVTRNLRGYRNSPIPVMSPQQFLTSLN